MDVGAAGVWKPPVHVVRRHCDGLRGKDNASSEAAGSWRDFEGSDRNHEFEADDRFILPHQAAMRDLSHVLGKGEADLAGDRMRIMNLDLGAAGGQIEHRAVALGEAAFERHPRVMPRLLAFPTGFSSGGGHTGTLHGGRLVDELDCGGLFLADNTFGKFEPNAEIGSKQFRIC